MRAAALLATSLLLMGTGIVMADEPAAETSWRTKADAPLLASYDAGATRFSIELLGPAIPAPDVAFGDDRAAWRAYWNEQSAAFRASVASAAADSGAIVTSVIPAINGVWVDAPRAAVPALLGAPMVQRAGLDWEGATFILGGEGSGADGPGIAVALDQTIAKVQAQDLWALGLRGEGVKLAMIDTGIRHTHEMLKNADGSSRVTQWFDATSANCASPCDTNGHGTHVTTTAAGSNLFNTNSPQGVAPRANIFGVKIFIGGGGTWQDAQEGLQGAFDGGAEITSNSWGGSCGNVDSDATAALAESLQNAGMNNVFAAGNSGGGGHICPGMVDNVVTVGAIDINEAIAGFSSRGPCNWPYPNGPQRICPDVVAVGVDVTAGWFNADDAYQTISGTSMATPHVAGVVTLLQQSWKDTHGGAGFNAAGKQAEIILRYSTKDLGAGGPDNDYGWGLAKGKAAFDLMSSGAPLNLQHIFSIGLTEMRAYQTNSIGFSVVNLGSVSTDGPISLSVKQIDTGACPPTCDEVVLSKGAALGPFTETALSIAFDGAVHPAGNYLVNARYDFTHDGGSGMIEDSGQFLLKKVHFVKTRAIPGEATTGSLIMGGWQFANVGNENAGSVRYSENFPSDGFVPAGAVPPGLPGAPNGVPPNPAPSPYGAFANPAPDRVNLAQRVTPTPRALYAWDNIGSVPFGTSWSAAANFVAGQPGAYTWTGTLRYSDETGRIFVESVPGTHVVKGLA